MRPIKFRGRDSNHRWLYGYVLVIDDRTYIQPHNTMTYPPYYEVEEQTIGQFTGLTDRYGVEIYEGDWLLHKHMDGSISSASKVCFSPNRECYGNYTCGFYAGGDEEDFMTYMMIDGIVQVIGNVHDHPGVIKGEMI